MIVCALYLILMARIDPTSFPKMLQFFVWCVETAKDFVLQVIPKITELAKTKGGFLLCLALFMFSLSTAGLTAFQVSRGADGSYEIKSSAQASIVSEKANASHEMEAMEEAAESVFDDGDTDS